MNRVVHPAIATAPASAGDLACLGGLLRRAAGGVAAASCVHDAFPDVLAPADVAWLAELGVQPPGGAAWWRVRWLDEGRDVVVRRPEPGWIGDGAAVACALAEHPRATAWRPAAPARGHLVGPIGGLDADTVWVIDVGCGALAWAVPQGEALRVHLPAGVPWRAVARRLARALGAAAPAPSLSVARAPSAGPPPWAVRHDAPAPSSAEELAEEARPALSRLVVRALGALRARGAGARAAA